MNLDSVSRHRSRHLRVLAPLFALLLGSALPLGAATYYVDYAAGSDANTGTSTTAAWKHCPGDPAASLIAGASSLVAGDTVTFKGGVSYEFTGASGIAVRWNGTAGSPITYDGNSAGTWGSGRARFTANYAANVTAFSAPTAVSYLNFKNLEISALGGAATLPADGGSAVAPRFGGGLSFANGLSNATIDGCVFSNLGYAFNQKPMAASSLSGSAIKLPSASTVTISNCDFSRLTTAFDLTGNGTFSSLTITNASFHDNVVWTFDLPASKSSGISVGGCTESNNTQFDSSSWSGYGASPRIVTKAANAGESVTLTATSIANPTATYQWQKNGQPISGAIATTLTLSALSTADAGAYSVIATNEVGSTPSNSYVLAVTGAPVDSTPVSPNAPVFATHPASQTVAPNSTATFTAAATGTPAPTITWFRNGITFPDWTGNTLMLPGITTNDIGSYTAVATSTAGSVTSNSALLNVSTDAVPTTPPTTSPPQAPSPSLAPAFTTHPTSQTVASNGSVTFTAAATGTPEPTITWFRDGVTFPGWTGNTLTLGGVTTNDIGSYTAVATNSAGNTTSNSALLNVGAGAPSTPSPTTPPSPAPSPTLAPMFVTHPVSQTAAANGIVTFTVAATGAPEPTITWFRDGITFPGWTGNTLTLGGITANDIGSYKAVATNSAGNATSNSALLTIGGTTPPPSNPSEAAPAITTQPIGQTVERRATVTFSVAATGTPAPTYKWFRNGITFPGWTSSTLTLIDVTGNDVGTYTVEVSNSAGSVTSNPVKLSIASKSKVSSATTAATDGVTTGDVSPASRLVNLSVRSTAGAGDDSLIVGFVVSGGTSKSLLMRGSGPALSAFGVTGVLADPTLALYSGSALLAANDDWSSGNADQIAPAAANAGAFAFANASRDAALLANVEAGAYTGQVSSKDAQPGTALIELYDTTPDIAARLVNVSVRTAIAPSGDAPVIGFVVAGTEPKKLLVRAVGPSLADFGVTGTVSDPKLELFAGAQRIDGNDDWSGDTTLVDTFNRVGAFPLSATASKDAALIVTAAPGDYTVVVSGANRTHGTVLVEVYELP